MHVQPQSSSGFVARHRPERLDVDGRWDYDDLARIGAVVVDQLSALARALGNQPVDRADDAQLDVDALCGAGVGGALMALLSLAHGVEDLHGRDSELPPQA